jgi:ABC-type branched-subunit amino acid transport system ATPase component
MIDALDESPQGFSTGSLAQGSAAAGTSGESPVRVACIQMEPATIGVILVEQHLTLALRVAGHAYVMDRGRIALEGPAGQVRDDPALIRYLSP